MWFRSCASALISCSPPSQARHCKAFSISFSSRISPARSCAAWPDIARWWRKEMCRTIAGAWRNSSCRAFGPLRQAMLPRSALAVSLLLNLLRPFYTVWVGKSFRTHTQDREKKNKERRVHWPTSLSHHLTIHWAQPDLSALAAIAHFAALQPALPAQRSRIHCKAAPLRCTISHKTNIIFFLESKSNMKQVKAKIRNTMNIL
jgi:hypothetical protein